MALDHSETSPSTAAKRHRLRRRPSTSIPVIDHSWTRRSLLGKEAPRGAGWRVVGNTLNWTTYEFLSRMGRKILMCGGWLCTLSR